MINRYNEFIIESLLSKLDESVVYYSDDFVETLKRIKSDISTNLLAMNSKDENTDINYIDVTDSDDQLSFIPDSKASELLPKPIDKWWKRAVIINPSRAFTTGVEIFKALGIDVANLPSHEVGTKGWAKEVLINLSDKFDNRKITVIHFKADLNDPNVGDNVDSVYAFDNNDKAVRYIDPHTELAKATKGRNPIKVGRLIKRLLQIGGYQATDKDIEEFVNRYKATYRILKDKFRNFKMIEGENIQKYYLDSNYVSSGGGSLGNSCMKYDACQTFFKIYIQNPKQVSMLIQYEPISEKIKGRALIWNAKLIGEESKNIIFMDRIYTNEDSDIIQFTDYATEQGWYFKQLQQSTEIFNLCGKENIQEATLKVKFDNVEEDWEYPYMDSFKFLNPETHEASNVKNIVADYGEVAWKLESQEGTNGICSHCSGTQAIVCTSCDGVGNSYCHHCEETGKEKCENCEGSGNVHGETCSDCDGSGEMSCTNCEGSGKISCGVCHGDGDIDCDECT